MYTRYHVKVMVDASMTLCGSHLTT